MHRTPNLPKGALVVISFEFFERFGLFSIMALLALFLTGARATGGMGWESAAALRFVGIFTGLMYVFPVIGGALADRWIGRKRAVAIGGVLMLVGYVLFTTPSLVPVLVGLVGGDDTAARFAAISAPLGSWTAPPGLSAPVELAYVLTTWGFHAAALLLVLGYAFVKSTLVVILGDTFDSRDERRHAAYAYYLAGINLGGLLSGFVVGSVAVGFGWGIAFLVPAVGMAIAVAIFLVFGRWLPNTSPTGKQATAAVVREPHEAVRLFILSVFIFLLLMHSIVMFQLYGAALLFLENRVDRTVGGFTIPSPWFLSLFSGVTILSAPLLARLWLWLHSRNREPDIIGKYALALALAGAGLLIFAWSAAAAVPAWGLLTFGIGLIAVSEVMAWTSTYGLVYRLAPSRLTSAAMGGFYAGSFGIGGYLAGWLGQFMERLGADVYFLAIGIASVAFGVVAIALRGTLSRVAARAGTHLRD